MTGLNIEEFKNRAEYNYEANKDISIQNINAIEIDNFRTLKNRIMCL